MSRRFEFTLSDELWGRLDEARGFESRASFVKRALEKALAVADARVELRAEMEELKANPGAGRRALEDGQRSLERAVDRVASSRPAHNAGWNRVTKL